MNKYKLGKNKKRELGDIIANFSNLKKSNTVFTFVYTHAFYVLV